MGSAGDRAGTDLIRAERETFDQYARQHGEFNLFAAGAWQTLHDRLTAWRNLSGSSHAQSLDVLDVGCGSGASLAIYESLVKQYVGIDLSAGFIARAQQNYPQHDWLVADAHRLPLASESFDLVAFSSVLHHLPSMTTALREAYRVLRPGGEVFAFDPHLLHPAMALFRWPKSPLYHASGVSSTEAPVTRGTMRRAFTTAGFSNVQQRAQSNLPYSGVMVPWMNALLGAHNAVDWLWEQSGIGRWLGIFICTYARKPLASHD